MEECPGPVLPFCRQPESEQEQLACGSSRGEQQFGSVWFHGENTFRCGILCFPVYCVRPCIASYVIRMPVAKLGLAPPAFCETLPLFNGRDPVFCEALPFCETLPSLMCETLPSVLIYIENCATYL